MILFQTINDNKELKEIAYADYRKTKKVAQKASNMYDVERRKIYNTSAGRDSGKESFPSILYVRCA